MKTLRSHPRLFASIALGMAVGGLLPYVWHARPSTHFLVAWNAGVLVYLLAVLQMCWGASVDRIRRHAKLQSEARGVTVALSAVAIVLALVAVVAQLATAKDMHGISRVAHVGLTAVTVCMAWLYIHTMYALLYAHDYYEALRIDCKANPGLDFPRTPLPDYMDFFYCAFIIATSGQTADVEFSNRHMRRTGLVHCVIAYGFNAVVLAMTINIAASFF